MNSASPSAVGMIANVLQGRGVVLIVVDVVEVTVIGNIVTEGTVCIAGMACPTGCRNFDDGARICVDVTGTVVLTVVVVIVESCVVVFAASRAAKIND